MTQNGARLDKLVGLSTAEDPRESGAIGLSSHRKWVHQLNSKTINSKISG
jgi:hypothetical protein